MKMNTLIIGGYLGDKYGDSYVCWMCRFAFWAFLLTINLTWGHKWGIFWGLIYILIFHTHTPYRGAYMGNSSSKQLTPEQLLRALSSSVSSQGGQEGNLITAYLYECISERLKRVTARRMMWVLRVAFYGVPYE